jgi:hypothetical protein
MPTEMEAMGEPIYRCVGFKVFDVCPCFKMPQ